MARKPYRAVADIDPAALAEFRAGIRRRYTNEQILAALRSSLDHKVVCLFDDSPDLQGRHVLGCTIYDSKLLAAMIGAGLIAFEDLFPEG